jgi:hypothetical protein
MNRYIGRTVEAVRWTGDNSTELQAFAGVSMTIYPPGTVEMRYDIQPDARLNRYPVPLLSVMDEDNNRRDIQFKKGQWLLRIDGQFLKLSDNEFSMFYEPEDLASQKRLDI